MHGGKQQEIRVLGGDGQSAHDIPAYSFADLKNKNQTFELDLVMK
jgi:hypothetical protein